MPLKLEKKDFNSSEQVVHFLKRSDEDIIIHIISFYCSFLNHNPILKSHIKYEIKSKGDGFLMVNKFELEHYNMKVENNINL